MRRSDLGVFEPGDRTSDGTSDGERAAVVMKQWAESDTALLAEAETIAHREHHEEAVEIVGRARKLAIA